MHHQTVGQDLQEGLYGEDDEEDVLHLFLKHRENTFTKKDSDPPFLEGLFIIIIIIIMYFMDVTAFCSVLKNVLLVIWVN